MTKSDQILWDALDRWGLPFRSTTSELIRLHGSKPSDWIEGYRICQVPTNSPLEDLFAAPLSIVIPPGMIRSHPPGNWRGSVRKYDDGSQNLQAVYDALRPVFGQPKDDSASNTKSWRWQFQYSRLTATVFPPELNQQWGFNRRHEIDPGSVHECTIEIDDRWRPSMSLEQENRYQMAKQLWKHTDGSDSSWWTSSCSRWHLSDRLQQRSPARDLRFLASSGELFIRPLQDVCWVIEQTQVVALEYFHLKPAKGAGGVDLRARLEVRETDMDASQASTCSQMLLAGPSSSHPLTKEVAQHLAERLGVPLEISEDYDC